jgi:Fic family protein
MTERNDYYDILERCQKGDREITQWLKWFLGCFQRSVEDSQTLISKVLSKSDFWQQHGQTTLNDRQRKVINRLLDAGRDGFEGGLTTRKYVSMARVSRATAFREISDLVEKRILLQNEGRGRNTNYGIRWREA